jgi:hypothetical protein
LAGGVFGQLASAVFLQQSFFRLHFSFSELIRPASFEFGSAAHFFLQQAHWQTSPHCLFSPHFFISFFVIPVSFGSPALHAAAVLAQQLLHLQSAGQFAHLQTLVQHLHLQTSEHFWPQPIAFPHFFIADLNIPVEFGSAALSQQGHLQSAGQPAQQQVFLLSAAQDFLSSPHFLNNVLNGQAFVALASPAAAIVLSSALAALP